MKWCSISPVIKEMKIKNMQYYFIPDKIVVVVVVVVVIAVINNNCENVKKLEPS